MGFGGVKKQAAAFSQQDKLTDLSNQLAIQAGQAKQTAAQSEAADLRAQGDLALLEAEQAAALKERETANAAGQIESDFLNSGVLTIGSPLALADERRRLGAMEVKSINDRAAAIKSLYYGRATNMESAGLSSYLQAIGSGAINTAQNKLTQELQIKQEQSSLYRGLISGVVNGGLSIARAFF